MNSKLTVTKLTEDLFNEFISRWHFSVNDSNPEVLQAYLTKSLYSFIFLVGTEPIGAFGVVPLWKGVGECWFMSTPQLNEMPLSIIKTFRHLTSQAQAEGFHRLQLLVHDTFNLNKWATALGFVKEGLLRKYGADKKDNVMYSKIWE